MESLLAGVVAGHAMGLFSLGLLAPSLLRLEARVRSVQARLRRGTPLPVVTAGLAVAGQALWALTGLAFGAAYWAIRANAEGGLGSPAWGFTVVIVVLAAAGVAVAVTVQPGWWRRAALAALAFAGAFGWLLPNLAEA